MWRVTARYSDTCGAEPDTESRTGRAELDVQSRTDSPEPPAQLSSRRDAATRRRDRTGLQAQARLGRGGGGGGGCETVPSSSRSTSSALEAPTLGWRDETSNSTEVQPVSLGHALATGAPTGNVAPAPIESAAARGRGPEDQRACCG